MRALRRAVKTTKATENSLTCSTHQRLVTVAFRRWVYSHFLTFLLDSLVDEMSVEPLPLTSTVFVMHLEARAFPNFFSYNQTLLLLN